MHDLSVGRKLPTSRMWAASGHPGTLKKGRGKAPDVSGMCFWADLQRRGHPDPKNVDAFRTTRGTASIALWQNFQASGPGTRPRAKKSRSKKSSPEAGILVRSAGVLAPGPRCKKTMPQGALACVREEPCSKEFRETILRVPVATVVKTSRASLDRTVHVGTHRCKKLSELGIEPVLSWAHRVLRLEVHTCIHELFVFGYDNIRIVRYE